MRASHRTYGCVHPRMPRTAVLPYGVTQLSEVYATVMYQKYQKIAIGLLYTLHSWIRIV